MIGAFRPEFDGSQDYDVMRELQVAASGAYSEGSVPLACAGLLSCGGHRASPGRISQVGERLEDALVRRGLMACRIRPFQGAYQCVVGSWSPTVSVIIPFRDRRIDRGS